MKKCVNGKLVEMSEEETSNIKVEIEAMAELAKNQPPTDRERLEILEEAFMELAEVVANG